MESKPRRTEAVVTLADIRAGSITRLEKVLLAAGFRVERSSEPLRVQRAKAIVLAGAGRFAMGMDRLRYSGLEDALLTAIEGGAKVLGISLGMHLLFDLAEEDRTVRGLGLIPGTVKRFNEALEAVPHRGKNRVRRLAENELLAGIAPDAEFYFDHTHYANPANVGHILAETEHGITFASVCTKGRIFGIQFLPERSGQPGLKLLQNFVESV